VAYSKKLQGHTMAQ